MINNKISKDNLYNCAKASIYYNLGFSQNNIIKSSLLRREGLSDTSWDTPGTSWDAPANAPDTSWDTPGTSWDAPDTSWDTPGTSWDAPANAPDTLVASREDLRDPNSLKLRFNRIKGGLGSMGRRALGILPASKTEGIRSAARGVAETVQGSSFGETASDWYSGAHESVNNYVNNPENREAAITYARSLGTTCLEGAGVIKKTKHWEGVAGSGYRPSATGITRAAINPFGAARRGLMAGGDQVVRDLMQAKGGLTDKGVQYVQNYAAQQNPFMRFGINQALKRAKKQGWI